MSNVIIEVKRVRSGFEDLPIPVPATIDSAGVDLRAAISDDVVVKSLERVLIPTSFAIAIPSGYEGQVRPRSGLAIKNGISILNAPGTIDADYRGEVQVILINLSAESFTIHRGDRIAQLLIAPVSLAEYREVSELSETTRGSGGFGHSGIA